jgi:hypothetical protein
MIRSAHVPASTFFAVLIGLLACDLGGSSASTYPTTLRALPKAQLEGRIAQYHRNNDHEICSRLNEFGLTIGEGCLSPERIPDDALGRKDAVDMAKQALVRNEQYTNVSAEAKLRLKEAVPLDNAGKPEGAEWQVRFKEQRIEGKRVHDTRIIVWLTASGVYRIGGHWYQNVTFPDDPISRPKALESALGYQITYSGWGGRDTLTVSEEHLPSSDEVNVSVLPDREGETVKLRVIWELSLSDVPFGLYVDAAKGQVVGHEQPIF